MMSDDELDEEQKVEDRLVERPDETRKDLPKQMLVLALKKQKLEIERLTKELKSKLWNSMSLICRTEKEGEEEWQKAC